MKPSFLEIFSFSGRIHRGDYFCAFCIIPLFFSFFNPLAYGLSPDTHAAFSILGISMVAVLHFSLLSFHVRRLHDINQTGWLVLPIALISFSLIWLFPATGLSTSPLTSLPFFILACIPGTKGENRYGTDSKANFAS